MKAGFQVSWGWQSVPGSCRRAPIRRLTRCAGEDGAGAAGPSSAPNTRKKLTDSCAHYGISLLEVPKGLLGQAIGKPDVKAAALLPAAWPTKSGSC